jgi:hypothetical protein
LTPTAAADAGSSAFDTSIHAQTLPACVRRATNERAADVLPEHSGPVSSLTAPTGKPPCNISSSDAMPVVDTGRIIRAAGVSAEGIFCARAFSIWSRIAVAEGIRAIRLIFAYRPGSLSNSPALVPVQFVCNQ